MRRRTTRGFLQVRKPSTTSYIETGGEIALAAGATAIYPLLIASDTPNKSLISDLAANSAQCENNSRIVGKSFIQIGFQSPTGPATATAWLYMNAKNLVTAPANGFAFNQAPLTEDNAELRAHTLLYRRVTLTPEVPRNVRLKISSKRNSFMNDASILNLVITNPAATAISYNAYGRIHVVEG